MDSNGDSQRAGSLLRALAQVPDPRSGHGRRHPLSAILALAVAAMLSGARSLTAVAQWGRDYGPLVAKPLGFTRDRTPAVSTLHEVFSRMDHGRFEQAVGSWLRQRGRREAEAIAVDGKSLRGLHGEQLPGVHLVAAYGQRSGIALGQEAVGHGENELAAVARLLECLDLRGQVVTGDAQFTQRSLAQAIVEKGGTTSWW